MPSRIARNAVISLLIFALVLGITRSNFTLATAVRPYVEAILTRSTSFGEIGMVLRSAASALLSWNPWSSQVSRGAERAGDGTDSQTRGTTAEPRESATGAVGGGFVHGAGADGQVASRGPTAARALSVSVGRVVPELGRSQGDEGRVLPSEPAGTRGLYTAEADGQVAAPRTTAAASSSSTSGSAARASTGTARFAVPVSGQVTYGFGYRIHPIYKRRLFHNGVDIAAPAGAPVRAAAAGRVLRAGPCGTYGRIVELDHGGGLTTLYAHCSRVLVRPGDMVRVGQKIAEVGSTGLSTGPHLHFEVSAGGKPVDPFAYLEGGRRERL